jgi:2-polyprenyl-3-methyl-5-hydroxy-6-metoxy-1,4-benzoquinol methylase
MAREEQQEKIIAELYDKHSSEFYDYHAKRGDVEFYVALAVESGGTVLDIGCGTGRILIPTASAGVSIIGLDKSVEMLDIC